jgi:hypothetical protein
MPFPPASPFVTKSQAVGLNGLQGLVLLAVEDSRLACEALRLMCQRSGARLRRAEGLASARAHLAVCRPDVVLVDIAMSGDPEGREAALAAGAAAFLEKPLPGLLAFQSAILAHLPDGKSRQPIAAPDAGSAPDALALRDDLARAATALAAGPNLAERAYLSGFLAGIARQTVDAPLGEASARLRDPDAATTAMSRLIDERIRASTPFRKDR